MMIVIESVSVRSGVIVMIFEIASASANENRSV
jgi:hypothetical protein